jgi:RES domain-containing protein
LIGVSAYRLVKKKWVEKAFDGEGAKRFGGRWNSRGKSCVYLAAAESLAILEILVHLDDYQVLTHYLLFEVVLPQRDILYLPIESLPACWRDEPAPPETAEIGDAWLAEATSLALAVPSVIVPREWNFILNPTHPAFKSLVSQARRLSFEPDGRLV